MRLSAPATPVAVVRFRGGASIAPSGFDLNRRAVNRLNRILAVAIGGIAIAHTVAAQKYPGYDSTTREHQLVRDLFYGTAMGVAFSGFDQWRDDPEQWGDSWNGYGKRVASNLGGFYIQEGVTYGLSAAMNRPMQYPRCNCIGTGKRAMWAVRGALFDQLSNGKRPLAVPRIVGAYAGTFAQVAWRPKEGNNAWLGFTRGTSSLAIGALINLYHEFAPSSLPGGNKCRSGQCTVAP